MVKPAVVYVNADSKDTAQNGLQTQVHSIQNLPPNLPELALVDHSSDDLSFIGGKTPSQLASIISNSYPNKSALKHIYVVSCEAGFRKKNETTLAQELVQALRKEGFSQVLIHAVAPPVATAIHSMRVKLVTHDGIAGAASNKQIEAFYYANAWSETLDKAIEKLKNAEDTLVQQITSELKSGIRSSNAARREKKKVAEKQTRRA